MLVSFVKSIQESGLDISLAYCAERIEDLADLKADLIHDGIHEEKIGLLHSSGHFYKDILSIERSEAENYQFLLLAHGRVQHRFSSPDLFLYYQDEERNLVVWDEALLTTQGNTLNVDMLILAPAIEPETDSSKLAEILAIPQDEHGFFSEKEPDLDSVDTSREGIFIAGCAQSPKDVPDTVAEAEATVGRILSLSR